MSRIASDAEREQYAINGRLRASHGALLAAAKSAIYVIRAAGLNLDIVADLRAAITKAEEIENEPRAS